ncbi:elongator complex protein 5 isoform X2 [Zootermopsis nevadensis]|nr:elongator complex protein 5 isoform X2 [Zootermopsis nevadensis]XP_021926909.1 elongator complex protein 5 isoform X2 [Zootermopsis nevadensis]
MKNGLKNSGEDHVHFHDCFTDHRGWIESQKKENIKSGVNTRGNSLLSVLQSSLVTSTNDCVVIIDSLMPLIYYNGFTKCYRELHSLLTKSVNGLAVSQVVCLVHKDTLPDAHAALPQLCHLAATIVRVGPFTQSSRGNPIAHIIHKKQGGKVLKRAEYYFIDADNRVKSEDLTVVVPTTTGMNKEMIDDSNLPQNLTTFKLSLGQQEKQARSQLVLPYLRRVNSEKGGEVFYQPDAADDWDEEDPDDDLDI